MRKHGAFRFSVKTSAYVITASGVASLVYRCTDSPIHPSARFLDFPFNSLNGVVRSSRAIFTIASCVLDYRRSLFGVPSSSDEYGRVLSEAPFSGTDIFFVIRVDGSLMYMDLSPPYCHRLAKYPTVGQAEAFARKVGFGVAVLSMCSITNSTIWILCYSELWYWLRTLGSQRVSLKLGNFSIADPSPK